MSKSLSALQMVFSAQQAKASRNRAAATEAISRDNAGLARLHIALARGREIHVDKLRNALESLGKLPEATRFMSDEEYAAVMEDLSSMVMTAASERQPLIESILLQAMKAHMSHQAASRQSEVPAQSYHVCLVCGYIAKNAPPERCPVCRAQAAQFEAVQ